jgi:hypothetical protein
MALVNAIDALLKVPVPPNAADLLIFVSVFNYFRAKFRTNCLQVFY